MVSPLIKRHPQMGGIVRALPLAIVGLALWSASVWAQQPTPPPPQAPPPAVGLPTEPNPAEAPEPKPPQPSSPQQGQGTLGMGVPTQSYTGASGAAKLLGTPVSRLFPGNVPVKPSLESPVGDSREAAQRGMQYFQAFNCVGCHAPNGSGGMGPSLSNSAFIYGSEPAQIYLTIYQGRPRGMPAWGGMLPEPAIWDLVAYVRSISREPSQQWGKTVSAQMPQIEQVPAEYVSTPDPWGQTEAFSHGQKPNRAK